MPPCVPKWCTYPGICFPVYPGWGIYRVYASLCTLGGGYTGICLPVYPGWCIPGYMPSVYPGRYTRVCLPTTRFTVGLVGGSPAARPVPRRTLTRFTVGLMLGSLGCAHLSTFSQERGIRRAERPAPKPALFPVSLLASVPASCAPFPVSLLARYCRMCQKGPFLPRNGGRRRREGIPTIPPRVPSQHARWPLSQPYLRTRIRAREPCTAQCGTCRSEHTRRG